MSARLVTDFLRHAVALTAVLGLLAAVSLSAQSLGAVAKETEAKRKTAKPAGKVYTNDSLSPAPEPSSAPAPSSASSDAAPASDAGKSATDKSAADKPADDKSATDKPAADADKAAAAKAKRLARVASRLG